MTIKDFLYWLDVHNLCVVQFRWEGDKVYADVADVATQERETMKNDEAEKAGAELKRVIAVYKALYKGDKTPQQRISDGAAYIRAHPEDRAAPAQLAALKQKEWRVAYQIIDAAHAYDVARGDAPMDAEIAQFLGSVA